MTEKTMAVHDKKCKADPPSYGHYGGKNYGLDCITGAVYFEGKHVAYATNCVFCGKENES